MMIKVTDVHDGAAYLNTRHVLHMFPASDAENPEAQTVIVCKDRLFLVTESVRDLIVQCAKRPRGWKWFT